MKIGQIHYRRRFFLTWVQFLKGKNEVFEWILRNSNDERFCQAIFKRCMAKELWLLCDLLGVYLGCRAVRWVSFQDAKSTPGGDRCWGFPIPNYYPCNLKVTKHNFYKMLINKLCHWTVFFWGVNKTRWTKMVLTFNKTSVESLSTCHLGLVWFAIFKPPPIRFFLVGV